MTETESHSSESPLLDAQAHQISLAVWDVPSPLVKHRTSKMKVGARCSEGCCLTGQSIEIRDKAGLQVASGRLGQTPWDGTSALYWAEVELPDPANEGTCSWSATFVPSNMKVAHQRTSLAFSFLAVKVPEHVVIVRVIEASTHTAVEDAEVRLGVYKARSDGSGCARMEVPAGTYELNAWKAAYSAVAKTVEVAEDIAVQIEAKAAPEAEEPYWM